MILKIRNAQKDGWWFLDGVGELVYDSMAAHRALDELGVDIFLASEKYLEPDSGDTPPCTGVRLFVCCKSGEQRSIFAEHGDIYLMNDGGKTVEHF